VSIAEHKYTNRLAHESSPYLLQHQHNPVDWYPWGPEALERARREDKPIFLSVGYSTCYWCHVMERQCFENEAVAREMNERFINIKVDREERPDIDQLYMMAVQVLTHHGGWPMSVWLTPDLRPFYAGTYFPPEDVHGRPGFVTVLRALDDYYRNRRDEVERAASELHQILRQLATPMRASVPVQVDDELIRQLVQRSVMDFDPAWGGFGGAPKFPRQTLLELLLTHNQIEPDDERSRKIARTLDAMAMGGIRDQLGGAFHRYSTDARWLVPHFEIMLYDNALLAWIYTEQYRQTEDRAYAQVAREVMDFVLAEMTSPEGAFYTAIDAEVEAREGGSYLWTAEQIEQVLGPEDARIFNHVYGVDLGPNFADPHGESDEPHANVLYQPRPIARSAQNLGIDEQELVERLREMRRKLKAARDQRPQPMTDTKILTAWNALMIRALAHGGKCLGEKRYIAAAERAARWLLRHHMDDDANLYRTSRDGQVRHRAFLEDYAYLCQALLALDEAGGDHSFRETARSMATVMIGRFADEREGGFYFTDDYANDILVRQKLASDSPLPSANAVAARVLIEIGQMELAQRTIAAFAAQMAQQPEGMSAMVQAALYYLQQGGAFTVEPASAEPATRPLPPEQAALGVVEMNAAWASPQELRVRVEIQPGYHLNAHEPAEGMIPTELQVYGVEADEIAAIEYPPGVTRKLAFAEEELRLYEGTATLVVRFSRDQRRESPLRLALRYQACSEDACLPAVTRQIEVSTP